MRSKSEGESESKTRQRAFEVLASHLPMDRRQALSRGETLPSRSTGAALFADVSGFTRLTETLGRTLGSQRGAEALSARLNGIYSALIAEVHDRRGSVIMFSGDAITCWFDGDDGRRATACALDLQRVMSQQPSFTAADGDEIELAIKVGVSHGPVRRFLAGDPDIRWLDVIAGATLERVAVAESLAGQGEVILAPEVADALGDHLTSLERRTEDGQRFAIAAAIAPPPKRDPWPPLGPQTLPEARIRPFLDPAVYERLRTGQALFLAEIRSVVPLFLSFTGLDFDHDDEASDKLDHYVREVQEVVQRFEGSVIDLTVGDKGTYLFSVFGAPVAHEDDAARAVAAALELRDLSRRATAIVDPRLGISQGRLHTGPSGSPSRQTYTALGDETNVAARLMSHAAAGEILASDRIARAAAPWFRFRELGSLALKGKQDQLLVHRVLGSRDAAGNTSSSDDVLVGRRAEREQLSRMLRHLIAHREHTTIVIEGEAGIGKSCLVDDLLRHARNLELRAFVGAADAIEDATPFLAWQPIWRALFGIDGLDEVAAETRVRNVLKILDDDRSRELAPLLNPLLSLDLPPSSLTAQLYGKPRAESTRDLLIALLRKFSRSQPLVIVIEDVHWLDSASWDFVETMVHEGLPLVLILATRPATAASAAPQRRLYELPAVSRLQLGPLSHEEILELVCRRLGVIALPESLAALLRAKTEGNPFFSEELAYALRDAGLIEVEQQQCRLAPRIDLAQLDFPETIEGVVTSRLDRLTAAEQLTVKVASVVGRVFALALLADIHPVPTDRHHVGLHLETLVRQDIARPHRSEPSLAYIFKHIITQEVAYNRMLLAQRRRLHEAVASWYEAQSQTDSANASAIEEGSGRTGTPQSDTAASTGASSLRGRFDTTASTATLRIRSSAALSPLLAHHWSHAVEGAETPSPKLLAKAISYLETAGRHALSEHASHEVLRFLDQALKLDARLRCLPQGRHQAASAERRSTWHAALGHSRLALGELAKSRTHFVEALTLLSQPPPSRRSTLLLSTLRELAAQVWHGLGPSWLKPAKPLLSERKPLLAAAQIHNYLAETYFFANDPLPFLLHLLRFANLAARAGPSAELAESSAAMGVLTSMRPLRFTGDFYARRAAGVDPSLIPPNSRVRAGIMLALASYNRGHWQKMHQQADAAIALCERLGDRHHWGELMNMQGNCSTLEGELEHAEHVLERIVESGRERNHSQHVVWGLSNLAGINLRRGRAAEAAAQIEAALPSLELEGDRMTAIYCYGVLAIARWRLGDPQASHAAADLASEQMAIHPWGTSPLPLVGYVSAAEAQLSFWRHALAEGASPSEQKAQARAAQTACRGIRVMGHMFAICRPDALRCDGMLDALAGRRRRALRKWRQSLAAAHELAMPYEQARAHLELARHLPAEDPASHHHQQQAEGILFRFGCDASAIETL